MGDKIKYIIRPLLQRLGVDVVRLKKNQSGKPIYPSDFSKQNIDICDAVHSYTMTSPERVNALIEAVKYIVANKVQGAMVECGAWKGGSSMAMALTLMNLGIEDREIYIYDTFSGMPEPADEDISITGEIASKYFSEKMLSKSSSDWCLCPLDEVKDNVFSTGYPKERFHFIQGKVEDTIPLHSPKEISLLRLDTDWYESTRHELTHLFPLVNQNGVLIIDDYGFWKGARKATDEYFSKRDPHILLNRIDSTGRIAIKTR